MPKEDFVKKAGELARQKTSGEDRKTGGRGQGTGEDQCTVSSKLVDEAMVFRPRRQRLLLMLTSLAMSSALSNSNQRRTRPARRRNDNNNSSRRGGPSSSPPGRRSRPGKMSNIIPPLKGVLGAPELPTLMTRDPAIIERWLAENVPSFRHDNANDDGNDGEGNYSIIGVDVESIAKPPWRLRERAHLPDGPATIQLATTGSCLIVQLALCGDGSAGHAPSVLRELMNDPNIIKCGVSIDDDALELYRWSKEGGGSEETSWQMASRLDLGCILPDNNPSRRAGLRELGQKVLGVDMLKSKRLAMSNWGGPLSLEQIAYAARDAWVAAALVQRLQETGDERYQTENIASLLRDQRLLEEMDARATARKEARIELKELKASEDRTEDDEVRMQELQFVLDTNRPALPPTFDKDVSFPLTLL